MLPLEEAAEGLRLIRDREVMGKVVVAPDHCNQSRENNDMEDKALTVADVQELISRGPFHQWLGLEVLSVGVGQIEIRATWREEWVVNPQGRYTHGGILAALIDLTADWALVSTTGRGVPTIDMRVDYHRVAMPGDLT